MSRLLLPLLIASILPFIDAASNGNVVVTTDAFSTCKQGGNLTLAPDVCISAPTTKPYDFNAFDPMAFHELSISQYATCNNVTTANFIIYQDLACQDVISIYDPNRIIASDIGLCFGLLEFRSAAFSCGGGTISTHSTTVVASPNTVTAATTVPYVSTASNPFLTSTTAPLSTSTFPFSYSGSSVDAASTVPYVSMASNPFFTSTVGSLSAATPATSYPGSSVNASTSISPHSNSSTATAATQSTRTTSTTAATFTADAMLLEAGNNIRLLAFITAMLLWLF